VTAAENRVARTSRERDLSALCDVGTRAGLPRPSVNPHHLFELTVNAAKKTSKKIIGKTEQKKGHFPIPFYTPKSILTNPSFLTNITVYAIKNIGGDYY
jgi:hypothetical protein